MSFKKEVKMSLMGLMSDFTQIIDTGSLNVTVGDGVTTEQIIRALRRMYFGGVKCHGWETSEIVCGQGTLRFISCSRRRFTGLTQQPLGKDVIDDLQQNVITYEIGLRWLFTSPTRHIPGKGPLIFVLPKNPIVKSGLPQALVFGPGSDTPYIRLQGIDPEQPFPQGDILTAHEIYQD
ncbi:MAG: hypothetical protein WC477_04930 [Patescibacteria group bacterium]